MPDLMNETIDHFRQWQRDKKFLLSPKDVQFGYQQLPPGSKLRLLYLHNAVFCFSLRQKVEIRSTAEFQDIMKNDADFAIDFLTLVRDQLRGNPIQDPIYGDGRLFHVHGEGIGCSCPLNGKKGDAK